MNLKMSEHSIFVQLMLKWYYILSFIKARRLEGKFLDCSKKRRLCKKAIEIGKENGADFKNISKAKKRIGTCYENEGDFTEGTELTFFHFEWLFSFSIFFHFLKLVSFFNFFVKISTVIFEFRIKAIEWYNKSLAEHRDQATVALIQKVPKTIKNIILNFLQKNQM